MNIAQIAKVSVQAARAAGAILLDWRGRTKVTFKAPADLVTEADFAAQECIRGIVEDAFPSHDFLGEESAPQVDFENGTSDAMSPTRWIVDPLDGTTNYVHGLPYYCVSIAVEHDGQVIVGTVYDPVMDLCFHATRGGGAYENDQRISVSNVTTLSGSLAVTGFPPMPNVNSVEVRRFARMLGSCQAVRRMGAAALNMCHLAAGRFDLYWVDSLKPWDIAAGLLIIEEAGGTITAMDGSPIDLMNASVLASSTPALHAEATSVFEASEASDATREKE